MPANISRRDTSCDRQHVISLQIYKGQHFNRGRFFNGGETLSNNQHICIAQNRPKVLKRVNERSDFKELKITRADFSGGDI